jgi:hypothetical protein
LYTWLWKSFSGNRCQQTTGHHTVHWQWLARETGQLAAAGKARRGRGLCSCKQNPVSDTIYAATCRANSGDALT